MSSLDDVTVLDLSRLLPGPYCTMLLADMGARVIKVEDPKVGDITREMLPGIYYSVNRNKQSVAIDIKQDEGKEIIYRLAAGSDVVVEGFRPGVVDRLRVGYEDLKRVNPNIIYCSISGFGQTGPYRLRPGHDINYWAVSGAASIPSSVGVPPVRPCLPLTDLCAGMFGVITILAALLARRNGAPGQYLDVSMTDAIFSWVSIRCGEYVLTGDAVPPEKMNHLIPANDIYDTADGQKISIGAMEEHFWHAFLKVGDLEGLLQSAKFRTFNSRRENVVELKAILRDLFLKRTLEEWIQLLKKAGVPYAPVQSIAEAFDDPQLKFRQMITEMFVPYLEKNIKQVAFPVKMPATPTVMVSPPPALGEHTDAVLKSIGFSPEELEDFRCREIIR